MTIQLPPMQIAQGEPFAYQATVTSQNWTGYTGTATFKARPKTTWKLVDGDTVEDPIIAVAVTGNTVGLLQFALTAAEASTFPALDRLGYRHSAVCEIAMVNASTGDAKRYQARVSVAPQI